MTVAWFDGATLEVSIAFGSSATSVPGDGLYTDVSAYVRGVIGINRGRSSERDTFQTGSLSITFDNRDRRFDPDYSSSPYSPNLVPMCHIRARLTYSATTSYLFKGYVQGWPQEWERSNNDGTVTIVAHDAFKLLSRRRLPESAWAWEADTQAETLQAWYRLGESTGAALAKDSGFRQQDATYAGTTTLVAGMPEMSADGAQQVTSAIGEYTTTPIISGCYAPATGANWTIGMWVRFPAADVSRFSTSWLWLQGDGPQTWYGIPGAEPDPYAGGDGRRIFFGYDASTKAFVLEMKDSGGTTYSAIGLTLDLFDEDRHWIVLDRTTSVVRLWVDGVNRNWGSTTGSVSAGSVNYGTSAQAGVLREGTWDLDEVTVYNGSLGSTVIETLWDAGSTAFAGDTVDARIARVITDMGSGILPVSLDVSTTTVRGCDFTGKNALDYLQTMERTEGGQARLFMAADGTLTFHSRYHDSAAPTVVTAFSDVAGTTLPYREILFDGIDDVRIANSVSVSRTGGVAQLATDNGSDSTYGTIGLNVSGLENQSDLENQAMANGLLYAYKDPKPRIRGLTIAPRSAPSTLFPKVRTTEIGERVSVRRLPVGVGSAWTKEQTVEGVSHSISVDGDWQTTYLTAPADTAAVWWILGDSTYGILGTARVGF